MAEGRVLIKKSTLTEIGNAIREKTGKTDLLNPDNMPQEIESIESGGGGIDYLGLRLSQKELYEYSNSVVVVIPKYAFFEDYKITKCNFSKITKISDYGFYNCTSLIEFNAPNITKIEQYGLCNTRITQADFPNATTLGRNAFSACNPLESANLPQTTTAGMQAFQNAVSLQTINIPLLNKVLSEMFGNCYTLKYINLPNATSIETNGFKNCYRLKSANFTKLTTLSSSAFYSSYSLQALIIQTNSVATLSSSNVFTNCYHILGTVHSTYNPDGLKDGYIYVPDNLVADYQAASNWSTYATQIKGLSQLPQEYADLYGIEIPSAPAGYTLTLNCDSDILNNEYKLYSLDNGATWNKFTSGTMVLQNVTQIKFSELSAGAYRLQVGTTSGGNDIADILGYESENITISANTTLYVHEAAGGGYD